jgi:hypothetical protein
MLLAVDSGQSLDSSLPGFGIVLNINVDQDVTIVCATTTMGTIGHGGILNGTPADVFTSTPVAIGGTSTLALTDILEIVAKGGTLNCSDVTLFNAIQGSLRRSPRLSVALEYSRSERHALYLRKQCRRRTRRQDYGPDCNPSGPRRLRRIGSGESGRILCITSNRAG